MRSRDARGASLAGVLVIVVVLGGLAASAVIGVNAMTGTDDSSGSLTVLSTTSGPVRSGDPGGLGSGIAAAAEAACRSTAAAADSAGTAYFVGRGGGSYPTRWSDLTAAPAVLTLPDGVVIDPGNPAQLDGGSWKLVMDGGGSAAPTFTCKPGRV